MRFGDKFYSRFSLKTKIIIFCILCVIGGGIVYKEAVQNGAHKSIIEKQTKVEENAQPAVIKSTEEKKSVNDEAEKVKEEKNKVLEQKYEESTKAFSEKRYSDCIAIANSIIKEDDKFYKAYNIKGIAVCYSGNFQEGMENIDVALQLNPNYGYARFNKALAYELFGQYDDSLTWYDKNLEIEKNIWSYYGKASIYGRRGDDLNAVKYLKIAIEMDPEIKKYASEESDFNPVKNSKEFQNLINNNPQ